MVDCIVKSFKKKRTPESLAKQSELIKKLYQSDEKYKEKISIGLKKYYSIHPNTKDKNDKTALVVGNVTKKSTIKMFQIYLI